MSHGPPALEGTSDHQLREYLNILSYVLRGAQLGLSFIICRDSFTFLTEHKREAVGHLYEVHG